MWAQTSQEALQWEGGKLVQVCPGTWLGLSQKGLHLGNSPFKGKPAWLVTQCRVVIQVRDYDSLMNDAGASLPGPTLEAKGSAQWIPISESPFELASLNIQATQGYTHLPNVQIALGEPWLFSYTGWVASRFWHLKAWSLPKRRSIEVRRGTQSLLHLEPLLMIKPHPVPRLLCRLFTPSFLIPAVLSSLYR